MMIFASLSDWRKNLKTYVFKVELELDEDGRWGAGIPSLPGCAAWGYTQEEALEALRDAAEMYMEDLAAEGEEVPIDGVEIIDDPVVAVTLSR